jgi:hypothetical protein
MWSLVTGFSHLIFKIRLCCSMAQDFISFSYKVIFYHIDIPHFMYSSGDEYLSCFHFCIVMNYAAVNIHIQVLCGHVLFLFGGTAGSYATSTVNLLRNSQTIFHNGCTILQYNQQFWGLQYLYILANIWYYLFYYSHSNRCKVASQCGLIYISLMISLMLTISSIFLYAYLLFV